MVRILSGGGQSASGRPTTSVQGRPGFKYFNTRFRQSVRRLMKTDPADAVLTADIRGIPTVGGAYASLATALAGTNEDLVFTSKTWGPAGNNIRVRYVNPGTANAVLGVVVSGNDITVNLATSGASAITTTANDILAAINADATASKMVRANLKSGNDGTGVVTALAYTNLTGGTVGEMRKALPPELAVKPTSPTIIGHEEDTPTQTKPNDPSVIEQQKFGDVRVRNRGTNRSLKKR